MTFLVASSVPPKRYVAGPRYQPGLTGTTSPLDVGKRTPLYHPCLTLMDNDRANVGPPKTHRTYPPQAPHALPSLGPHARPCFVLRNHLQRELCRVLLAVFNQRSPVAAAGGFTVAPLAFAVARHSQGGIGLGSLQRPALAFFAAVSRAAIFVSCGAYC